MLSAIVILLYIFYSRKTCTITVINNCTKQQINMFKNPNASRYRKALPQAKCLVFLFFFTKLFKELANLFSLF